MKPREENSKGLKEDNYFKSILENFVSKLKVKLESDFVRTEKPFENKKLFKEDELQFKSLPILSM